MGTGYAREIARRGVLTWLPAMRIPNAALVPRFARPYQPIGVKSFTVTKPKSTPPPISRDSLSQFLVRFVVCVLLLVVYCGTRSTHRAIVLQLHRSGCVRVLRSRSHRVCALHCHKSPRAVVSAACIRHVTSSFCLAKKMSPTPSRCSTFL